MITGEEVPSAYGAPPGLSRSRLSFTSLPKSLCTLPARPLLRHAASISEVVGLFFDFTNDRMNSLPVCAK